jgi:hypothetical protein
MHVFELRPVPDGFELRGGQLTETMVFREDEPRPAVHLVGFLSQKVPGYNPSAPISNPPRLWLL